QCSVRYSLHALPLSGTGAVSAARARAQDPRRKGAGLSQASGCGSRVVRRAPRADAEVPANTGNVAVILAPASSFSRGALGCHGAWVTRIERGAGTTLTNLACRSAPLCRA